MISEVSGNVYWEISAFQHVVVVSSTRGKGGGKAGGGYRTLEVIETLTEYSTNVFSLSEGDRSSNRHQHLSPFANEYIEEGETGAVAGGFTQTLHADYPVWIIRRRIRSPAIIPVLFHVAFIRRFASTTRAI